MAREIAPERGHILVKSELCFLEAGKHQEMNTKYKDLEDKMS